MRHRSRWESELHLLDSAAGLAVCDTLMQSNMDLSEVSAELLRELLYEEWRRRRFAGRPALRLVSDESAG